MKNLYFALLLFVASSCVAFAAHESGGSSSGSSSEPQDDNVYDWWVFCLAHDSSSDVTTRWYFSELFGGEHDEDYSYKSNFARYVSDQYHDATVYSFRTYCLYYDTKAEAHRKFRSQWRDVSKRKQTNWSPDL